MYWCWTGITGTSSPTIAPVRLAKLPLAEITCSQVTSPLSVTTRHSPLARALDRLDERLPVDLAAAVARAARQRLGQIGGLDVAVAGVLNGAQKPVGDAERPDLRDLGRREEFHLNAADGGGDAGIIAIFVEPVLGARQADVGDLTEADVHPRFRAEAFVERHRVFVQLADGIAQVEQRQQARGVPRRA